MKQILTLGERAAYLAGTSATSLTFISRRGRGAPWKQRLRAEVADACLLVAT